MDLRDVMSNFIIKAKYALKINFDVIKDAEIEITDKTITYFGKQRSGTKEDYKYQDYPYGLVMPAFVNGHTHLPETLIRGLCDDEDLHTWLYDHVWQVEPVMTAEQAKVGALLGIAEMIRSGTVAFVDQYFYANQIAEAVAESGVKAFLGPSIFDGNPETKTIEKAFQQNKKVFDTWNSHDNRIFIGFGPHAHYSVPEDQFREIIDAAKERNTMIHTHVSETKREVNEAKEKYKLSPVGYLEKLGALDHILAAHCIHMDDSDIALLHKHAVTILSNPQSNLKIGAGIAPIPYYLEKNLNIILGTDGSASNNNLDIMEEARLVSLIHKGLHTNPKLLPMQQIIPLFTSNASKVFPNNSFAGVLSEGKPADLVVYDLHSVNNTPIIHPVSNMFFSSNTTDIVLTMADGKILYEKIEGKESFKTINIEEIKKKAQQAIEDMMSKADYTANSIL